MFSFKERSGQADFSQSSSRSHYYLVCFLTKRALKTHRARGWHPYLTCHDDTAAIKRLSYHIPLSKSQSHISWPGSTTSSPAATCEHKHQIKSNSDCKRCCLHEGFDKALSRLQLYIDIVPMATMKTQPDTASEMSPDETRPCQEHITEQSWSSSESINAPCGRWGATLGPTGTENPVRHQSETDQKAQIPLPPRYLNCTRVQDQDPGQLQEFHEPRHTLSNHEFINSL